MAIEVVNDKPSGSFVSVRQDGFEIRSNTGTEEELRAELGAPQAAEGAEVEEVSQPKRRRQSPVARMLDATAKEAEAKRERDEAKAESDRLVAEANTRAETLAAELATLKAPKPAAQEQPRAQPAIVTTDDPEPKIEDFAADADPYTAWVLARAAHTSRTEFRRLSNESSQQRAAAEEHAAWMARVAKIPDFQTRFKPETPIDTRIQPYLKRNEMGGEVVLYLSEHQDEAQRLTTLHPVEQIGRIGEIIGELKAEAKARTVAASPSGSVPKPQPISQAKPPIKPLGATPATGSSGPPGEDASEAEHEAYWGKRRKNFR